MCLCHVIRPGPSPRRLIPVGFRSPTARRQRQGDPHPPRRASRSRTPPPPRREASERLGVLLLLDGERRQRVAAGERTRQRERRRGRKERFSDASASVRGARKDGLMQKAFSVQLLRPSRSRRRESWPQSGGSVPPQSASVVHLEEEDKYSCIDHSTSYLHVQSVRDFPIEKLNAEVILYHVVCRWKGLCQLSNTCTKQEQKCFWSPVGLPFFNLFTQYSSQLKLLQIGGSNFLGKAPALNLLASLCDGLFFVGKLSLQIMNGFGMPVPSCFVEKNSTKEVLQLIQTAHNRNIPIYYPTDTWCLNNKNNNHEKLEILNSAELLPGWTPADIGPSTLEKISSLIPLYKKVLWIGPTGFDLTEESSGGAAQLGRILDKASHDSCDVILVGSAACKAVKGISGSSSKYTTFKNASVVLEFLKGKILPGVAALDKSYPYQIPWNAIFSDSSQPLMVDIGSGNGLFLFQMARNWEGSNFLGLEMNKKLVVRCLRDVASVDKRNLYFVSTNATSTFRSIVSSYPGQLALVTIQCPNPDFNREQNRWRMVRRMLVEAIADLLQPNGKVYLQSDVESVLLGMKEQFMTHGKGQLVVDDDGGGDHQMDNPFGAASDWERHVLARGAPMYRTMLRKVWGREHCAS
uniref:Phosphoglycerate kinase n=1 Tax=Oryza glumipatula TaxID=40148 RepID=A0A0E0BB03_9ORYZ